MKLCPRGFNSGARLWVPRQHVGPIPTLCRFIIYFFITTLLLTLCFTEWRAAPIHSSGIQGYLHAMHPPKSKSAMPSLLTYHLCYALFVHSLHVLKPASHTHLSTLLANSFLSQPFNAPLNSTHYPWVCWAEYRLNSEGDVIICNHYSILKKVLVPIPAEPNLPGLLDLA